MKRPLPAHPITRAMSFTRVPLKEPVSTLPTASFIGKYTTGSVGNNGVDYIGTHIGDVMHYSDAIMGAMVSQITSLTIVYSTVYSGADQRKHQSSAWLRFVQGTHRWPVNSPHKGPVTRERFPFDNVIMDDELSFCSTVVIESKIAFQFFKKIANCREVNV